MISFFFLKFILKFTSLEKDSFECQYWILTHQIRLNYLNCIYNNDYSYLFSTEDQTDKYGNNG